MRLRHAPLIEAWVIVAGVHLSGVTAGALDRSGLVDGIAIVVNDEPILLSDLRNTKEAELTKFQKLNPGVPTADLQKALGSGLDRAADELIRLTLIEQDAKRYGLGVTDYEVDDAIERMRQGRNISREQLASEVMAQGLTWDAYRREIRLAILFDRVKGSLIRPRVSVTEAEIRAQYDANFRNQPEEARVQMLFLPFAGKDDRSRLKVRERAQALRVEALDGADFSALVRTYSSGPNSASGGDLGTIRRGTILPFLEEVIFSTETGSVSQVVTDDRGAYVIKVVSRSGGGGKTLEQVYPQIRYSLENQKIEEAFGHYIEDLVAAARVQRNLPGISGL